MTSPSELTAAEESVLNLLADAAIRMAMLSKSGPNEHADFFGAIHECQRIIMARPTRRSRPDLFSHKRG